MNLRACWTMMRVTWMIWFQNRAFFFLLAFGWMISPLVALFIWSTAADGRSLGGMTQGELVAYYLVFILVNQLTYSQTYWTFGDKIRDGRLSPMLLRPFSPVLYTLVTEVEGKGVYLLFVVPVSTVLALLLHPKIHVTLPGCLTFVVSLLLAWFLRFFWGYWIALLAFWVQRADIALAVQDACIFLLAGQAAPITLLPAPLRIWAQVLPFRSMISFPVEILTGHLNPMETVIGLMLQICWSLIASLVFLILWRNGLRRYTAIGG